LAAALDPALWNSDGTALTYPNGAQFFDRVKQAVDLLDKVNGSSVGSKAEADLWAIADELAGHPVIKGPPGHANAYEQLKQAWRGAQQNG
jgi:hypothetical protein